MCGTCGACEAYGLYLAVSNPIGSIIVYCDNDNVINDLDAHGLKDLGRCMSELKNRYSDCLDTRKANKLVKKSLVE